VKAGYPVINAEGLVGRVVDVGPNSSRVLLASDVNSRIPVSIGPNATRAILIGDNGPDPRLLYLPDGAKIAVGDDVATSGVAGLFPPGLRIGTVTGDPNEARVLLRANLDRLAYVSVLFFNGPSRALAEGLAGKPPYRAARGGTSSKSGAAGVSGGVRR
jgi:rod shape-determining protein MreC